MKTLRNPSIKANGSFAAMLSLMAAVAFSQPASALDAYAGGLTIPSTGPEQISIDRSVPMAEGLAEIDSFSNVPDITPQIPSIPAAPAPAVTLNDNQVVQTVIQTTLNNASQQVQRALPAGQININLGDAAPAAGGDEMALGDAIVATVDENGDGLLVYSVSDMTVVESLAPAAGGMGMDKQQKKEIMNSVYDQVIYLERTEPVVLLEGFQG